MFLEISYSEYVSNKHFNRRCLCGVNKIAPGPVVCHKGILSLISRNHGSWKFESVKVYKYFRPIKSQWLVKYYTVLLLKSRWTWIDQIKTIFDSFNLFLPLDYNLLLIWEVYKIDGKSKFFSIFRYYLSTFDWIHRFFFRKWIHSTKQRMCFFLIVIL